MTQRERFEAWVRRITNHAQGRVFLLGKHSDGDYKQPSTQAAWIGWQAACPEGSVALPVKITAETGHKYALIGEFSESLTLPCPECDEDEPDEDCEICLGIGEYEQPVPIEWDTIKRIHDRIVSVSAPPQTPC